MLHDVRRRKRRESEPAFPANTREKRSGMNLKKLSIIAGIAVLASAAIVTGCSSGDSGTPAEGTAGPGELADEALVTYSAPDGSYSFKHPKSWTEVKDKNGNARFAGRDAFVGVEVMTNAGTDAMAFATKDKATVAKDFAGYKELSLKASTAVKNAVVLSFEWDAGNSTVTGKPVHARIDRYYMPQSGGRMAVMTGSEPASGFDLETIRDVALGVKVK